MATSKIGTLRPEDRQAFYQTASRLGVDPYELGAVVHQESGFRPNVWGGAGGKYRGLIQFGPGARKEVGLPDKSMSISEQLPYVEKYLQQRGYQPGMGVAKLYATILGGNPNVSLHAKDSFGTSVASSLPRFKKGGELYQAAQRTLGDPMTGQAPQPQQPQQTQAAAGGVPNIFNIYMTQPSREATSEEQFLNDYIGSMMKTPKVTSSFDPLQMLVQATGLNETPSYS